MSHYANKRTNWRTRIKTLPSHVGYQSLQQTEL